MLIIFNKKSKDKFKLPKIKSGNAVLKLYKSKVKLNKNIGY